MNQHAPSGFDAERRSVSTDVALLILVFGLIFFSALAVKFLFIGDDED